MNIQKRFIRQRIQHIVDSYQLDGDDGDTFTAYLARLIELYPQSLVELALTETLVKGWSEIPMQRGMPFLHKAHQQLRLWQPESEVSIPIPLSSPTVFGARAVDMSSATVEPLDIIAANADPEHSRPIETRLTPAQFEQITGLDASLVFDVAGNVLLTQPMELKEPPEPPS